MNKNIYIGLLLLFVIGVIIDGRLKLNNLQNEVNQLSYEVGNANSKANKYKSKIAKLESRINKSMPGNQSNDCEFSTAKYKVRNMGYLNFELTNYNDIRCRGKLKGKKINEIVEVMGNTMRFNNESLKVELIYKGECNRFKGFLTWLRTDDTWEIDDMLLIKV